MNQFAVLHGNLHTFSHMEMTNRAADFLCQHCCQYTLIKDVFTLRIKYVENMRKFRTTVKMENKWKSGLTYYISSHSFMLYGISKLIT
jgi:hypothetical protein